MSVQFLGGTRTGAGGQPLPFSPAVTAGPFVFVSGQVAMGDNGELVPGGIEAQTRQTLKNVEKALALAGCTLKDVVKSTVWLDDARDFWTFNRVYAEFFSENKPARSTTQATLMIDAKVEIEVDRLPGLGVRTRDRYAAAGCDVAAWPLDALLHLPRGEHRRQRGAHHDVADDGELFELAVGRHRDDVAGDHRRDPT